MFRKVIKLRMFIIIGFYEELYLGSDPKQDPELFESRIRIQNYIKSD
jgi:hypothetical protein